MAKMVWSQGGHIKRRLLYLLFFSDFRTFRKSTFDSKYFAIFGLLYHFVIRANVFYSFFAFIKLIGGIALCSYFFLTTPQSLLSLSLS